MAAALKKVQNTLLCPRRLYTPKGVGSFYPCPRSNFAFPSHSAHEQQLKLNASLHQRMHVRFHLISLSISAVYVRETTAQQVSTARFRNRTSIIGQAKTARPSS